MDPDELGRQPSNVHIERFLLPSQVLPRCAAVVSHGGSGSVVGALAHGLPMVLLPLGADQPLNARRCETLGVARVLDSLTATPAAVRDALTSVSGTLAIGAPRRPCSANATHCPSRRSRCLSSSASCAARGNRDTAGEAVVVRRPGASPDFHPSDTARRRSMPDEEKAPASSDVVIESFRTQMEILQLMRKDARSASPIPRSCCSWRRRMHGCASRARRTEGGEGELQRPAARSGRAALPDRAAAPGDPEQHRSRRPDGRRHGLPAAHRAPDRLRHGGERAPPRRARLLAPRRLRRARELGRVRRDASSLARARSRVWLYTTSAARPHWEASFGRRRLPAVRLRDDRPARGGPALGWARSAA